MEFKKRGTTKVEIKAYNIAEAFMLGILAQKIGDRGCYHTPCENYTNKESILVTIPAELKIFSEEDLYRHVDINKIDMQHIKSTN